MVNSIKSLFQVNKQNGICQTIVDIEIPVVSDVNKSCKGRVGIASFGASRILSYRR